MQKARGVRRSSLKPQTERLENRALMTAGTGPTVTSLSLDTGASISSIVVGFSSPLDPASASDLSNYGLDVPASRAEFITAGGRAPAIVSAVYNASLEQVTLTFARPLRLGTTYRLHIYGQPGHSVLGADGTLLDGDDDQTPGGDYYATFAEGKSLSFIDNSGDRARVAIMGGGAIELVRQLNGDVASLQVANATPGSSVLVGTALTTRNGPGAVYIPSLVLDGAANQLPATFTTTAPTPPPTPTPIPATPGNPPYTLQFQQVSLPSALALQSMVSAQWGNYWLLFGGRTNGLHNFNPTGNFPPQYQNNDIVVIDPSNGQSWTRAWSSTGLTAQVTDPLSSAAQEFRQVGNTLYAIGGYSQDSSDNFTTYDTLTAVNVPGLVNAVIHGGPVAPLIRQISDPRLQVTGGDLGFIGGRAYLVFGQLFEGQYTFPSTGTQIYTDEIQSFRIVNRGKHLGIANYQAQRDPVNFRRRDGNLIPIVGSNGKPGLSYQTGVFTVAGNGYLNPVVIGSNGVGKTDFNNQQLFQQYNTTKLALYSARDKTMSTVFLGGIGLDHYDPQTGVVTTDTELPWVNDVTAYVRGPSGKAQEYMMTPQLPGYYGAESAFFNAAGTPSYGNGVIKLDALKKPTIVGYMYGGIVSTVPETSDPFTQTTATNAVFRVVLVPNS